MEKRKEALALMRETEKITFLTGAGVSVASGIPDYRSIDGVYHGHEQPEYLLSHSCLVAEPTKFYEFVKNLYHPKAQPNAIHFKMAELAKNKKSVKIVTQNIDQLHQLAKSPTVINFHGNLYDCYCSRCGEKVKAEAYLNSDRHEKCGGQVRPDVVLYEEGLPEKTINAAVKAVHDAELIVIVGTSFKVQPFSSLVHYKQDHVPIIVVNQEEIYLQLPHLMLVEDAVSFFEEI